MRQMGKMRLWPGTALSLAGFREGGMAKRRMKRLGGKGKGRKRKGGGRENEISNLGVASLTLGG